MNTGPSLSPSLTPPRSSTPRPSLLPISPLSDTTVREYIWNGRIPVEIHLDDPERLVTGGESELTTNPKTIRPAYMMLSRLFYFPLIVPQVRKHFGGHVSDDDTETSNPDNEDEGSHQLNEALCVENVSPKKSNFVYWFSWRGDFGDDESIILPWHYPVGLLFDLCVSYFGVTRVSEAGKMHLPWQLCFHVTSDAQRYPQSNFDSSIPAFNTFFPCLPYSSAPDDLLLPFYFSRLKESDCLRSGSARNVMNLSRAEQVQLWDSLSGDRFEKFWRINGKLVGGGSGPIKNLPIRIYVIGGIENDYDVVEGSNSRSSALKGWASRVIQVPIPQFIDENSQPVRIGDLINTLSSSNQQSVRVLAQGIEVPLEAPLNWLTCNLSHADNFLHLIFIFSYKKNKL